MGQHFGSSAGTHPFKDCPISTRFEKKALRRTIRRSILELDPGLRQRDEAALIHRLPALPGYARAKTVLFYARAFPEEIDTRQCAEDALKEGKRVVYPRVDRSAGCLRLFEVSALQEDLVPGTLGIPEPAPCCTEVSAVLVDWVLVPGLAFDLAGYRLGRGAGLYDRLLPLLRPDAPCWALCFDCQIVSRLPVEPHDVRLSGVVSPTRRIAGR